MKIKEVFLLLFISLLFTFPFFQKGYFSTHDGEWAIVRLTEISREIRDLQFPPRWSDFLNHGFGYPLFLFTYPLPYYLGEVIHIFGMGFTDTIKILFVGSVIVGSFGMYFFSKRYWGRYGAIISSILYITVPYRSTTLYIRGSLGESIAMTIIPWLFWAVDKYLYKEHKTGILVSLLFAALILSHNTSALIFSVLLFFYIVFYLVKNRKGTPQLLTPFLIGLFLSAYFWLPVMFEKKFVYLGSFPLADKSKHFVTFEELLIHGRGFNGRPPLFLGYVHIIAFILGIGVFLKLKNLKVKRILKFSYVSFLASIFLLFPAASPVWKLPGFSDFDFPWRIMVSLAFLLSLISGSLVLLPLGKKLGLALLLTALLLYFPYVKVGERFIRDDAYYETNDATTTSADELMPIWVKIKPTNRPRKKVVTGEAQISDLSYTSKFIEFIVDSNKEQQVIINILYFPGWKFWINEDEIPISIAQDLGVIRLTVPQGKYKIQGKFTRTPIRILGDSLTVIGLVIIILELRRMRRV